MTATRRRHFSSWRDAARNLPGPYTINHVPASRWVPCGSCDCMQCVRTDLHGSAGLRRTGTMPPSRPFCITGGRRKPTPTRRSWLGHMIWCVFVRMQSSLEYPLVASVATSRQDDIAISMGCSPAYAAQVASQLDSMSGAVPVQGQVGTNQQASLNPPPPPADNKKPGGKKKQVDAEGSATAGKGGDTNTELPNKKARPPRPEARHAAMLCNLYCCALAGVPSSALPAHACRALIWRLSSARRTCHCS